MRDVDFGNACGCAKHRIKDSNYRSRMNRKRDCRDLSVVSFTIGLGQNGPSEPVVPHPKTKAITAETMGRNRPAPACFSVLS